MAIFSPRWPSPDPPAVRFTRLYPALTRCEPVDLNYRPITNICLQKSSDFVHFLAPSRLYFMPLDIKIWPRDYHGKIRHGKLPRNHISNVSNRPLDPILWSSLLLFSNLFLALSSRWPRPLCKKLFSCENCPWPIGDKMAMSNFQTKYRWTIFKKSQ